MRTFDVIVIGNGSMGLTLANQLKKDDASLKVAVIGPKERPGCASLAAGAMLNAYAEIPHGAFENETLSVRHKMSIASMAHWDAHAEDLLQYNPDLRPPKYKTLLILNAMSTSMEVKTFNYIHRYLQASETPHRDVDIDELSFLAPIPKYPILRALELPDGHIDSRQLMVALENQGKVLGVENYDNHAIQIDRQSFDIDTVAMTTRVHLDDKEVIEGQHVVLANGAYAQELIDPIPELSRHIPKMIFGAGLGLDMEVHQHYRDRNVVDLKLLEMDQVVRTPDRGGSCGIHLVPYGDGRFYLGASLASNLEPRYGALVDSKSVLLNSVMNEFHRHFLYFSERGRELGFRPMAADGFPLLGESHVKGIWFLNGMGRDGFTCAPLLAKEMSKSIVHGAACSTFETFRPCRPLLSYKTREEAMKDNMDAYLARDHHHGGGPQAPYLVDQYLQDRQQQISDVYDKRGFENFGVFSPLWLMYSNDQLFAQIEHRRQWD